MRLQLTVVFVLFCIGANCQEDTASLDTVEIPVDPAVIELLYSYYEQEGVHAAVTGGRGTEELSNHAPKIVVTVPVDAKNTFGLTAGVDLYSSASTDNINNPFLLPDHISGASADDARQYYDLKYTRKNKKKHSSWSAGAGMSEEFDVLGFNVNTGFEKSTKDNNKTFSAGLKYIYDKWLLIYPVELRQGTKQWVDTDVRQSFSTTLTYSGNINYRMKASISTDIVYQTGLLSTPFHRVYLENGTQVRVEQAPDSRLKIPVGGRFHYYFSDMMLMRLYYRFYWDDFGIVANTASLELPVKVNQWLAVYPFYRFHSQSEADHFAPYGEHSLIEEFFTSDYDLSAFTSMKYGIGVGLTPLFGFSRMKIPFTEGKRLMVFKRIDIRYSRYERSDGLAANVVSFGMKFQSQ